MIDPARRARLHLEKKE